MKVVIGVRDSVREIPLDLDLDANALRSTVERALLDGALIDLTDTKGDRVLIPAASVAFIQISEQESRHVGFQLS
ncbi:DUF3107 domain-containing protein [Schaalia sp. ZJ405]|uniref:DUF3107 domain-containing protein n=1 Tax=unclassified Schaalia TaxID=2691889 RepID=UPI0013EC3285|nr:MULTISPECIES: DUF3107 domain-containing protein [unclassified Schaalia]QPK80848.1 DUF3107 domain-containing protein [Schaalia sp. ZJ405]